MDLKALEKAALKRLQKFIDTEFAKLKQQVSANFAQARQAKNKK